MPTLRAFQHVADGSVLSFCRQSEDKRRVGRVCTAKPKPFPLLPPDQPESEMPYRRKMRTKERAEQEMIQKRGRNLRRKVFELGTKTSAKVWLTLQFGDKLYVSSSTTHPAPSENDIVSHTYSTSPLLTHIRRLGTCKLPSITLPTPKTWPERTSGMTETLTLGMPPWNSRTTIMKWWRMAEQLCRCRSFLF